VSSNESVLRGVSVEKRANFKALEQQEGDEIGSPLLGNMISLASLLAANRIDQRFV